MQPVNTGIPFALAIKIAFSFFFGVAWLRAQGTTSMYVYTFQFPVFHWLFCCQFGIHIFILAAWSDNFFISNRYSGNKSKCKANKINESLPTDNAYPRHVAPKTTFI